MRKFKFTALLSALTMVASLAHAGMLIEDANKKVLGFAAKIECDAGITCSVDGAKVKMAAPGSGGLSLIAGTKPTLAPFPVTALTGVGTSTTPSATTVYLTPVFVPVNATLTGVAINNAATCGTNKYIFALFNAAGISIANSALAGTLCSGASVWQKIDFTATVAVKGPQVYYVGLYVDGTTDRFYTIPAVGAYVGNAGSVTGQTFGTIAALTVPTSFTADKGPIIYTY